MESTGGQRKFHFLVASKQFEKNPVKAEELRAAAEAISLPPDEAEDVITRAKKWEPEPLYRVPDDYDQVMRRAWKQNER
jgi:hypothetical protein